ncbi:pirin family protein [Methyloprofundus sp.]|uniref:pirin family protein n=1 Tax=Methyloprofundus sp. TaxID=2020875 RepID=UPI003D0FE90E
MKAKIRKLQNIISGTPTTDGDGVTMTRLIGSPELNMLDPFLLLDAFETDQVNDYIGGFPDHPHRGFETVTYLIAGQMRHKDNAGHEGVIEAGGVQWMTAGKGIIHSEMPEQQAGLLQGFQLWINLPASEKMSAPAYQEFPADKIAVDSSIEDSVIRIIAGQTDNGISGPVKNNFVNPLYMDISLAAGQVFKQSVDGTDNAFIYVLEGELSINDTQQKISSRQLGVLSEGTAIVVKAKGDTRFILAAARPLHEPVARGGPFVMNTKAEIIQAFEDFQNNRF